MQMHWAAILSGADTHLESLAGPVGTKMGNICVTSPIPLVSPNLISFYEAEK
jgi:hypothetical protein